MTDTAIHTEPTIRKGRTFGLYRVIAPVLTVCAFALAFIVEDRSHAVQAMGQGVMMLAITIYAFYLKDRPVTARPPVHFPQSSLVLIGLFAAGAIIWGVARADMIGTGVAIGIPAIIAALALYLRSGRGLAWRESLTVL